MKYLDISKILKYCPTLELITKYKFSSLLNKAWGATTIPQTISAGFRRSGIYPFNPSAIMYATSNYQIK